MKVHLGCGSNILKGWTNVDIKNRRADMEFDIRGTFPFENESVEMIFSEHLIEHLTQDEGIAFLKECHRVLISGGVIRTSTPNLEWVIQKYLENKLDEWKDCNWVPASRCRMLNEVMRQCRHKFVYDREELKDALREAGFSTLVNVGWRKSDYEELCNLEHRPDHHEAIVEAIK